MFILRTSQVFSFVCLLGLFLICPACRLACFSQGFFLSSFLISSFLPFCLPPACHFLEDVFFTLMSKNFNKNPRLLELEIIQGLSSLTILVCQDLGQRYLFILWCVFFWSFGESILNLLSSFGLLLYRNSFLFSCPNLAFSVNL